MDRENKERSREGLRDWQSFLVWNGWRDVLFLGLQPKKEDLLVASWPLWDSRFSPPYLMAESLLVNRTIETYVKNYIWWQWVKWCQWDQKSHQTAAWVAGHWPWGDRSQMVVKISVDAGAVPKLRKKQQQRTSHCFIGSLICSKVCISEYSSIFRPNLDIFE